MTRDEAVARVKQGLGFKTNLDAEIVTAFQQLQVDLENSSELPFFLRKQYTAFNTVALDPTLPVPTDFIREWDDDPLSIIFTDGVNTSYTQELIKDSPAFLKLRWPQESLPLSDLSVPKGYARINDTFYFYPLPSQIFTFDGSYYAKDLLLDTNIENKWLKELPYILIARAGLQLAQGLRDADGLTTFGTMNDIFTAKLYLMTTADDAAGAKPVIGGED